MSYLQQELDDLESINKRLSFLLDATANALHGGPKENGLWSFHDIPERALEAMNRIARFEGKHNSLWRVEWNLKGTKGPLQTFDFTKEEKAMEWATGLVNGGAEGVLVIELILGRKLHLGGQDNALAPSPHE